jgi:3-hydroxyisobutyrate dehydrogenase
MGSAGSGQRTKIVNQLAIASGMLGVCEALLYASAAGLDVEQALEVISKGAAGSWSLSNYGPRAIRGDFAPGFKIRHFIKDLTIALSEAHRMGVALPGMELALSLYEAAAEHGLGDAGTHALLIEMATASGRDWHGDVERHD